MIETAVVGALNILISNPMLIKSESTESSASLETTRLNNELRRAFEQRECDKEQIRALFFANAEERYKNADDGVTAEHTVRLREIYENQKSITKFNGELFEKTVRRFYIHKDSSISPELLNNQIIQGSGIK